MRGTAIALVIACSGLVSPSRGQVNPASTYVGTWTLDVDSYEERVVDLVRLRIEMSTERGSSDLTVEEREASHERMIASARERAAARAMTIELRPDATFELTTSWEGAEEPATYEGDWAARADGFVLFDTSVEIPERAGAEGTSDALNWVLAFTGRRREVKLEAGRLGTFSARGTAFRLTSRHGRSDVGVPVAAPPPGDSAFIGAWRLDLEPIADRLEAEYAELHEKAREIAEAIQERVDSRVEGDAASDQSGEGAELSRFEQLRRSRVIVRFEMDGSFTIDAELAPEREGDEPDDAESEGLWLQWGRHVLLIVTDTPSRTSDLLAIRAAATGGDEFRDAVVLRLEASVEVRHIAGVFPMVRVQPITSLQRPGGAE